MKQIAQSSWSWTLFQEGNSYVLSVLCGSVAYFTTDIQLSQDEVANFSQAGNAYLDQLADEIRSHPHVYRSRHIPGFIASARPVA